MPGYRWDLAVLYTLNVGAQGCVSSFMPLFYADHLGLTYAQIGILGTLRPCVSFIASPFWTNLADRTKSHTQASTHPHPRVHPHPQSCTSACTRTRTSAPRVQCGHMPCP